MQLRAGKWRDRSGKLSQKLKMKDHVTSPKEIDMSNFHENPFCDERNEGHINLLIEER